MVLNTYRTALQAESVLKYCNTFISIVRCVSIEKLADYWSLNSFNTWQEEKHGNWQLYSQYYRSAENTQCLSQKWFSLLLIIFQKEINKSCHGDGFLV